MIKGIGIDTVDISRIERLINKYKHHFFEKVFTPGEIQYCNKMAKPAVHFAGRWAVKEAFYKALPLSCQKNSTWKSIELMTPDKGGPVIKICSGLLNEHMKKEKITKFHVSMSHEQKYCVAVVVLEE